MAGVGQTGFNPLAVQGNLNRVATHVVVTSYPALTVTVGYMGKSQAQLTFEGAAVNQIGTATGIINSPEPYLFGTLVISLLRTQSLANLWIIQMQQNATVGTVVAYPDATTFSPLSLTNCSIQGFDPGAYDGQDPVTKVTLKGTFYVNASMWAALTGPVAALS